MEDHSIDWEALNMRKIQRSSVEQPAASSIVDYKQVIAYFIDSADRLVHQAGRFEQNEDFSNLSFFERLALCFSNPVLST